jgi:hypothetical protein
MEFGDGVRESGQGAVIARCSTRESADRAQLAEDCFETLVGIVSRWIQLRGQPVKPPREAGRDHVDLGGLLDESAHARWQLGHVRESGISDHQEPLDGREIFDVVNTHSPLPAFLCLTAADGLSVTVQVS